MGGSVKANHVILHDKCVAINSVGQGHNSLLEANSYPGFRGRPNSYVFK